MSAKHLPVFQFVAYPNLPMQASMALARKVLDELGAMVIDIKCFSSKQIVFQVNVRLTDWDAFRSGMANSELNVDALGERDDWEKLADEDGDLFGTMLVVIAAGADDRKDLIPSVPG